MDNFLRTRRESLRDKDGAKVTQDKMAQRVGMSRGSVDAWERGVLIPPLKKARQIAEGYELPVTRIERLIVEMSRETAVSR